MAEDFIQTLTPQSTLSELPSYGLSLDVESRGKELGRLFDDDPNLPGVVVTEGAEVLSVLSRGQYLRLVSRNFGHEVFGPRSLHLMLDNLDASEKPLIMESTTGIQTAVSEALKRPRALIYEPIIVRDGGDGASMGVVDFPDLLRADSRISALRNTQMQQILATVEEGFLMVDAGYRIASEYSASLERLFGTEHIAGLRLPDFLRPFLGETAAELSGGYLDTLMNPNVIEKLVADINPLLKARSEGADGRVRFLRFRFVRGMEGGRIQRILVKVEDISREVELAEERQAEEARTRERMNLVFEIVRADPHSLTSFLAKLDRQLDAARELVDPEVDAGTTAERLVRLYRILHGLKGEAGLVGLQSLQQRIHRVEDHLSEARRLPEPPLEAVTGMRGHLEDLRSGLKEIRSAIEQLRSLEAARPSEPEPKTEPTIDSGLKTEPDPAGAPRSAPQVAVPPGSGNGDRPPPIPPEAGGRSPGLLGELSSWVGRLSERLGKPARFHTRLAESDIPAPYRDPLREILVQLARNSVVHGLEDADARARAGKPAVGTLQLALRRHPDRGQLELIFQDDGRGLDVERIRRRVEEQGHPAPSPEQALQWIFASGFSTADGSDMDAGRGVGLDLVKAKLEELGGHVIPHTEPGAYCAFQILLPLETPGNRRSRG